MIVRQAEDRDAAAVAALINDLVDNTTVTFTTLRKSPTDLMSDIQARGEAFLVVEMDGQVVGYASYFPFRPGPGYADTQEHSIVLLPEARGRGAGRALMTALEDVARRNAVHALIAGVSGENEAGIAFHAALGFEHVGRLPGVGYKFGRRLDLVLMQKRL